MRPEDEPRITEAEYLASLPGLQDTADEVTAVLPDEAKEAGLRLAWGTPEMP